MPRYFILKRAETKQEVRILKHIGFELIKKQYIENEIENQKHSKLYNCHTSKMLSTSITNHDIVVGKTLLHHLLQEPRATKFAENTTICIDGFF